MYFFVGGGGGVEIVYLLVGFSLKTHLKRSTQILRVRPPGIEWKTGRNPKMGKNWPKKRNGPRPKMGKKWPRNGEKMEK